MVTNFGDIDLIPVPVRNKAYEVLKRAIIQGTLKPGQRLVEAQIAEMLNISRTPLREAILKLEPMGFVQRLPNGGAMVASLSAQEIRELYAVRSMLEGLAARESAAGLTDEQLGRLADLTRQLETAGAADVAQIAEIGERFHLIILEASGNRKCREHLSMLRDQIDRYRYLTIVIPGREQAAAREHFTLLAVLRRRDPDQAEQAMRRHVLQAGESMMRRLSTMDLGTQA